MAFPDTVPPGTASPDMAFPASAADNPSVEGIPAADTAAALRAAEMECDILLKGTQVDGVYSADPKQDASATRYDELTYMTVLSNQLNVMDAAAISLARENKLPIIVFNIGEEGSFGRVMRGEGAFTRIIEAA